MRHNLGERVAEIAAQHRASCLAPARETASPAPGTSHDVPGADSVPDLPGPGTGGQAPEPRIVTRTRERHAAIHQLLAAGHTKTAIARALQLSRPAVSRFAAAATAGDIFPRRPRLRARPL